MTKQRDREREPRGLGEQKASQCFRLLVRNRPWRCHTGTMKADELPPWKKEMYY